MPVRKKVYNFDVKRSSWFLLFNALNALFNINYCALNFLNNFIFKVYLFPNLQFP